MHIKRNGVTAPLQTNEIVEMLSRSNKVVIEYGHALETNNGVVLYDIVAKPYDLDVASLQKKMMLDKLKTLNPDKAKRLKSKSIEEINKALSKLAANVRKAAWSHKLSRNVKLTNSGVLVTVVSCPRLKSKHICYVKYENGKFVKVDDSIAAPMIVNGTHSASSASKSFRSLKADRIFGIERR